MTKEMKFYFRVNGDTLTLTNLKRSAISGNTNTYTVEFSLSSDWDSLMRYAIFTKNGQSYIAVLDEDNICTLPNEILADEGFASIGLYGTNHDDDIKRISTNLVNVEILGGTFSENSVPIVPTPSVWEQLVGKTVPHIGEDGNWYIYNMESMEYENTNICAKADSAVYYNKEEMEDVINNAILDSWEAEV